jgi:glycosyltransferase involved in cell wall biosynthesis
MTRFPGTSARHLKPAPAVSIGLPVYNGERYLAEALDALLAQTYTDFELIISDNASTDRTEEICRAYAARDTRIRYIRQPVNIGVDPNHHFVFEEARGRYFKWASDDDLYAPDFVRRCVETLEAHPEAVLAHSADATIDEQGRLMEPLTYEVETEDPRAPARLRSLLHVSGGNDDYGVIHTDVIRRVAPYGSGGYGSDRVFVAALSLQGPFRHVPEILYFRREHPDRASRVRSKRERTLMLDPRVARRRFNPAIRLHLEYVFAYVKAIWRAPLTTADRLRCWAHVAGWVVSRARPRQPERPAEDLGRAA